MAETAGQRKVVGVVWFLAAAAGIVLAFLVQPVSDWGTFGILLAIVLGLLGLVGLWMAATGKGQVLGRNLSRRANLIISVVGLVAATFLILGYLAGDWSNWTALDVLSIAVWVALGAMFIEGIIATRQAP
jgi:nicotinamide riboside transporter PnuC